jgi:hypothetical protein
MVTPPIVDQPQVQDTTPKLQDCVLYPWIAAARPNLNDTEFQDLEKLLTEYRDIFAMKNDNYGRTDRMYHHIGTREALLIRQPLRRFPVAKQADVGELLGDMEFMELLKSQPLVIPCRSRPEEVWGPAVLHGLQETE